MEPIQPINGMMPVELVLRSLLEDGLIIKNPTTHNWEITDRAWYLTPQEQVDIINKYRNKLDK